MRAIWLCDFTNYGKSRRLHAIRVFVQKIDPKFLLLDVPAAHTPGIRRFLSVSLKN
jgi:hypothetical protein